MLLSTKGLLTFSKNEAKHQNVIASYSSILSINTNINGSTISFRPCVYFIL